MDQKLLYLKMKQINLLKKELPDKNLKRNLLEQEINPELF